MNKAVKFNMPAAKPGTPDNWVKEGVEPHLKAVDIVVSAPTNVKREWKRLTLEIPLELHARVKLACVQRDKTMLEEFIRLLETEFPAQL